MYTLRATPDSNTALRNSYAIGSRGRQQRENAEGRERLGVRMKEGTEGGWEEEGKREEKKEREKDRRVGGRKGGSHSKGRKLLRAEQDGILVANIYLTMIKKICLGKPLPRLN